SGLHELVSRIYDINADDVRMRQSALDDPTARGRAFDALRKGYPDRREFAATTIDGVPSSDLLKITTKLGFRHP
ncbi:MAG: DUF3410 domain-containing protein, partial [Verrucomicrobia bacterium]|nr:DUF3410 domain-containing protein [Verrucomicrobiota bacterium]